MISGNRTLKAMIFGLAVSALAIGGCSNQEKTAWGTVEPDAAALVVYADAGLGASDALGHQLYVEDSDTRFASAAMVYEMAWAEEPTLVLERIDMNSAFSPLVPRQVIVSGEGLVPQPVIAAPVTAVEPTIE